MPFAAVDHEVHCSVKCLTHGVVFYPTDLAILRGDRVLFYTYTRSEGKKLWIGDIMVMIHQPTNCFRG